MNTRGYKQRKQRDQKSNSNLTSSVKLVGRCKQAGEIAPPEIWSLIFEKLNDDGKSLHACYETCKMWNSMLTPHRTDFLFSEVFPILYKMGPSKFGAKVLMNDVDMWRCVSPAWRTGIDDFFQENIDSTLTMENRDPNPEHFFWSPDVCHNYGHEFDFFGWNDPKTFLMELSDYSSNYIYTKSVTFTDDMLTEQDGTQEEYSFATWKEVTNEFLPRLGHQIESCQFHFYLPEKPQSLKVILLAALKHLPKLKVLTLINCVDTENEEIGNNSNRLMEILGVDKIQPFPKLKHLTTLNTYQIGAKLTEELISLSDGLVQLNMVSLFTPDVSEEEAINYKEEYCHMEIPKLNFEKLSRLCLPKAMTNDVLTLKNTFKNAALSCLSINFWADLDELVQFTSHFRCTLQVLQITVMDLSLAKGQFDLPNLETLRVKFICRCNEDYIKASVDFILGLKSIKKFGVCMRAKLKRGMKPVIEFNTHFDHMYDSNIWQLMPNLEHLHIQATFRPEGNNSWEYFRSRLQRCKGKIL